MFLLYYRDFFEQICSDVQFISPPEEVGEFLLHLLKMADRIVLVSQSSLLSDHSQGFSQHFCQRKKTRTVGSADELSSETAGIYNRNGTGISICAKMESRYGKPSFFTELSDPRKKYHEADAYLETILSELPPEKRTL